MVLPFVKIIKESLSKSFHCWIGMLSLDNLNERKADFIHCWYSEGASYVLLSSENALELGYGFQYNLDLRWSTSHSASLRSLQVIYSTIRSEQIAFLRYLIQ